MARGEDGMETSLKNLLYDNPALYEEIYDGSGDTIPRMCLELFGGDPASLLDVGCGTGRDLEYYDRHGVRCCGIDLQAGMIAFARARRPAIEFHVGDMREFRLGTTFEVITCVGWALCNLHTPGDLERAMATFAAHSEPGTLLLLHLPNAISDPDGRGMPHRFTIDTPSLQATAEAVYHLDRRRQLLVRERMWSIAGQPDRTDFVRFRLLFPMEVEHYLTTHGFDVIGMYDNTDCEENDLSGPVLYVAARYTGENGASNARR